MISVKTINNQNAVINSVLGLDQNSNTIINGKLTIQDTSGSLVITPSGIIAPTNTVLNNLTVNGTSTYNGLSFLNSGGRVYSSSFMVNGTDLRVMDSTGAQGIQMFNSNTIGDNSTSLQAIGVNSRFYINTRDSSNNSRNNFTAENGNHIQIKGLTGGVDCLNDTVNLFSSTTTPTMTIAPTYPDNTTKIATTSFVSSAITSINPAITYPPTNSNTLNINNTISLTDGTTTNTLNQSDWTGTIKTVNTVANVTHFLNFSDSSSTGQGNPQKSSNLSCNPFLNKITATTFEGSATTTTITDSNLNIFYYPTFVAATGNGQALFVDSLTSPLTYNPQQQILSVNSLQLNNSVSTVSLGGSGGTSLTLDCGTISFRNFQWIVTGATNSLTILTTTFTRLNGYYTVGIVNNGTGDLTLNTGLGTNTLTKYTSAVIVPTNTLAVMTVQILSVNTITRIIVDAYKVA